MARDECEIAVLGAGPAGAAAALGLAALGYEVVVVSQPRARPGRESFSARVVAALRGLDVAEALPAIGAPCPRRVSWAGEERELPGEAQVDRAAFDAGLVRALECRGLRLVRDEALRVDARGEGVRIGLASGGEISAGFALDARGRAAPASGADRVRGPETLCLVQHWRAPARGAQIAVASLARGWAWCAHDGAGALTTQLAIDARDAPARGELRARVAEALAASPTCRDLLRDAEPDGAAYARSATAVLDCGAANERTLRIGDAAVAVDPLSGNGVFQALATALVAPAVVNTLLRRPHDAALARRFSLERARDVFTRFARVSRDFYALGAAHHGGAFWETRARWPDAEAAHGAASGTLEIALRPVVRDGFVEEREAVITPERPLGTWHLAGIELAPLVRALASDAAPGAEARALAALPEPAREPVRAWLEAHREEMRRFGEMGAGGAFRDFRA
ncbi:MAG: FAD-dependent oxidoreductase [Deltaproteobacteria bacterium]|nr:FAD-dependent oxidoreductase [Deltaproteobacteria bacterium]